MGTFDPLGKFDPNGDLNPEVIVEAKALLHDLPAVPSGTIDRIYCHWTVGHWNQDFLDYNVCVGFDGTRFHLRIAGSPSDNARGVNDNPVHSHTYMRNTGAVGIATDDMVFATTTDFGPEPLTLMTLEFLCGGVAALAIKYNVDLQGLSTRAPFAHCPTMLTHAEAGDRVGNPYQYAQYGPNPGTNERWDLSTFVPLPPGVELTEEMATTCGNALRQKSHRYKVALA
jgi:hypothetical protein